MMWRSSLMVAALVLGTGCGVGDVSPGPIVDNAFWEALADERDPFSGHREGTAPCTGGLILEGTAMEVDTERCGYASLVQPSLKELYAGDTVRVEFFHADLVAPAAAQAHAALFLGSTLVWEREFAIPANASAYSDEFVIDQDLSEGADAIFHLHNHGFNTWKLLSIERIEALE